ncbi:PREDICTED: CD320 antigen isoform X1 [Dipodomys ordii]|uniref:CD320 antigen isoform X1 n=1 Tax=Dipodomys ordii TaxID=10020 RepID=A0A1S3GJX4_DIPOR|nr:PREDICTED: CD320 antigen isoform X1 [Dipodomys ordii]
MARGGERRTVALGLVLRLLLGFGLGLEAAPTSVRTQTPIQAPGLGSGSCPSTSFQCGTNGYCVPLTWRCDGDRDCADGSDEEECRIEPCAQDGHCPPPSALPCSCDNLSGCPGGIRAPHNCSQGLCREDERRCAATEACVPHTWLCDGHPDCPDASDELGCVPTAWLIAETSLDTNETFQEGSTTPVATPVTLESITSLQNTTATLTGNQAGSPSAYRVVVAAGVLSAILVAATLLLLFRLRARGRLPPMRLLVAVKESLLLSERKTSQL